MKTLCVALAVLFSVETLVRAEVTNVVESFRPKYEQACKQIDIGFEQQKQTALSGYSNSLVTAVVTLKKKGDLDNFLSVQEELKRFNNDRTILPGNTNAAVSSSVAAYQSVVKKIEDDRNSRLSALSKQYVQALERQIKELMTKDKIEEAKQIKAELVRVQAEMARVVPPSDVRLPQDESSSAGQTISTEDKHASSSLADHNSKMKDITSEAKVTASDPASHRSSEAKYAVDGNFDTCWGPGDRHRPGGWIKLQWSRSRRVCCIKIHDRRNLTDWVLEATIEFSDRTKLTVTDIPNDGSAKIVQLDKPKSTLWVKISIDKISPNTLYAGFDEIAVFEAAAGYVAANEAATAQIPESHTTLHGANICQPDKPALFDPVDKWTCGNEEIEFKADGTFLNKTAGWASTWEATDATTVNVSWNGSPHKFMFKNKGNTFDTLAVQTGRLRTNQGKRLHK